MRLAVSASVDVRPLQAADREDLERFYEVFVPKDAAFGLPPGNVYRRRAWLDKALGGINFVAWSEQEIIGHMFLIPDGATAEMAVFVHQDFRRQGAARGLFHAAVAEMKARGLGNVWALVSGDNYACLAALRSFGFRATAARGTEVEMSYKL